MIQELISIGQHILFILVIGFAVLGFCLFCMTTFGEYSIRYVGDERREWEESTRPKPTKAEKAKADREQLVWELEEREEEEYRRSLISRQPSFPDFPKS